MNAAVRARWVISAVFLANGMGYGLWAAHMPVLRDALSLGEAALSLILMLVAVGALLGMPLAGWLGGRIGTHRATRLFLPAALGSVVLPILLAVFLPDSAPRLTVVAISAILFGIGNGALDVAMNAQASTVEKTLGYPMLSSCHGFFSLGGLLGSGLGGGLILIDFGRGDGMAAVLLLLFVLLVWPARFLLPTAAEAEDKKRFPFTGAVVALGALAFGCFMVEGAVADWSALLLTTTLPPGASVGWAAAGYTAYSLAMATCRFAGDRIVGRFGPVRTLAVSGLAISVGLLIAVTAPVLLLGAAGFVLVGLGAANVVPVLFRASANLPGISPSAGVAAAATLGYAGFLLGPPLIGWGAAQSSLNIALGVLAIMGLALLAGRRLVMRA
ncbi:MFS transporter [Elstera cyanobacteriorum]|uniref:MFS transporter n=1 Tax=Elstera cyanobacteriorum TaxID=2022747 RepID=UPI0023524CE8|nr:MFS transporter [Elstera cyanobacteriorum]MCK6441184.1 MFS transporter [Elstera cyanobacteriorum]